MAAARPAILVPFPYAVDDHQTANAQALVDLNGGEVLQQADMTSELLAERLQFWMADKRCETASRSIRESAPHSAKEKIVDELLTLCDSSVH
ncbi:MAG: UDP-N-acetylglucosamine--N-acetylmuramyl-(pentapeptide) pyrophosphoryl-undecaprenol N-acetylglucosamine transferase, partial [Hydrogenovibrio crunogenus]|nr:UDP-N-acetylglucosamine--N-acetylmuramyl-(pentapeptide) pyrophosphoryl-undecaprenol N-acetylglucosamine transferase [Hydrogenovibrio crunogenus]